MAIGKYCVRKVRTATLDDTARSAAQRMRSDRVGCLVVVDDSRPIGVVTDRDLALHVLGEDLDADAVKLREIVDDRVVTIAADASIEDAIRKLRRAAMRRLVVVDDAGKLVGLVAADDLLRLLATEVGDLGEALRVQFSREASATSSSVKEGSAHA